MRTDIIVRSTRLPMRPGERILVLALVALAAALLVLCARGCVSSSRSYHGGQPPWIYGASAARFTVVEFADLECAYCRMYFPTLRAWIDAHPDVNWEWRHLPLAEHEPAASEAARLCECAGEVGGAPLFWWTVQWFYQHPDEHARGLDGLYQPATTRAIRQCLQSARPGTIVRHQQEEAAQQTISATPTLRLLDRRDGRTVTVTGVVSTDVLSSAIDALASTH